MTVKVRGMTQLLLALLVWFSLVGIVVTPRIVLVDPNEDLQATVDGLDETLGGEIRLNPGTYTLTAPLVLDRPVKLVGAGESSTYIYCANADSDIVRVEYSGVVIRDLSILGPAAAGDGIGLKLRAPVGGYIRNFDAYNLSIYSTGSWCCAIFGPGWMDTTLAGSYSGTPVSPTFNRVTFYNNKSGGTLYAGHGVVAPRFNDCNFTGQGYTTPYNGGTALADSLLAWHWGSVLPPYHTYPNTALHRGHVYLCVSSDAVFSGCIFQNLTTAGNDEPLISIEDCISTRFLNSYFEVYDSTRAQPMVTMSAAQGFSFDGVYVRSAYAAPFHFLRTNTNPSSACYGTINNFWGYQGDNVQGITANERLNDFVFNSNGDASYNYGITISDTRIICADGTAYSRPVDVRQSGGGAGFYAQNLLFQNTSNRIRVPMVPYDSTGTMLANVKPGDLAYVKGGTGASGFMGRLYIARDNASFAPIPTILRHTDSTSRNSVLTAPVHPEYAWNMATRQLELYAGNGLAAANANAKWTSVCAYYSFADSTVRNDVFPIGGGVTTPAIPSFCWLLDRLMMQVYTGAGADDGWEDLY